VPSLSDAYLARLAAPKGVGDLVPADLAGEVGSVVGGSGVRVTLRLAADRERIGDARFRAFGSAAPLAPGSVLVERVEGLRLSDARAISPDGLLAPLGDVPTPVRRGAEHLVEALRLALEGGDASRAAAATGAPGVLVCRCLGVADRVIRRAIRCGAEDVEAVGRATAAGHGCHSCWPDLRTLLDEEAFADASPPSGAGGDALARAIDAVVRPLWRAQGVTLGRVAVAGDVVRLEAVSRAVDALMSEIGAVAMARHHLRETLGEAVRVELAPPGAGEGAARAHVGPATAR
jgi:bacterioferritin-associated ferredoxin/NifU-like protein involved in Fe-S cluster formation